MKLHEMLSSKFLKKEDCGEDGILATIGGFKEDDVGTEDAPEKKWTMSFKEAHLKPLVLNSTNVQLLEKALGTDDTNEMIGQPVVLYNDPNVSFGGKLTGGIRIDVNRTKRYIAKQAGNQPAVKAPLSEKPASHFDDFKDDVPFR